MFAMLLTKDHIGFSRCGLFCWQRVLTKWKEMDMIKSAILNDSIERSFTMGKDLGLRVSDTLQKRGMTQKELARRIGVTEAVVSRYISGE
jgi:ribosome-binding protein aMBF1 (putative translation factor)